MGQACQTVKRCRLIFSRTYRMSRQGDRVFQQRCCSRAEDTGALHQIRSTASGFDEAKINAKVARLICGAVRAWITQSWMHPGTVTYIWLFTLQNVATGNFLTAMSNAQGLTEDSLSISTLFTLPFLCIAALTTSIWITYIAGVMSYFFLLKTRNIAGPSES